MVALLYAAVTMYITIHLIHDSYNTYAFDLGIFTQELKNTLQGQILYSPALGTSQFAIHFSPILILLVPLYRLFPHAQMLLAVQSLLLAFGGYLIYVIAREYNYSHRASLILEGLYFVNPLVWGVALFDFHEVAFAIPALLVMFLGMKRKNWIWFSVGFIVALATKEDAVVALGVFGFVMMLSEYWQHKNISKISIIIFCAAIFTYGLSVIISRLASGGESPGLLSFFTSRYAYICQPLSAAIPLAAHTIFSNDTLFLIDAYFLPLALLPLLAPKWVIPALLILLSGILSTDIGQHGQLTQYPAVAIPFLFMAFIEVLPRIKQDPQIRTILKRTNNRAIAFSLIPIVIISIFLISQGRIKLASLPDAHDTSINQIVASVPDNATVTASNIIFPHLVSRTDVYLNAREGQEIAQSGGIINHVWGYPEKDTEYIIIDTKRSDIAESDIELISSQYTLIKKIDGVMLFQLNS